MAILLYSQLSHALPSIPSSSGMNSHLISAIEYVQLPPDSDKDINNIEQYFASHSVNHASSSLLSLGISHQITWVKLSLHNPTKDTLSRYLTAGKTWIDSLDVYSVQGHIPHHQHAGDYEFASRHLVPGVGFVFPVTIPPGNSHIFIRAESQDPMTLPIDLQDTGDARGYHALVHITSGWVYGVLMALIGFNLVLYFTVKQSYTLYYCCYIACFIIVNLSYNGFGFAWFYPHSLYIQNYCTLIFMVLHGVSGLIFIASFLSIKRNMPLIYKFVAMYCVAGVIIMSILIVQKAHIMATHIAFNYLTLATLLMIAIAGLSIGKVKDARYFLVAVLCSMLGLLVTTLSVRGNLPYNYFTFNSAVFGVVLEAIILAIIVSIRLKAIDKERITAQYLSAYDPLTNIFNRRSFFNVSQKIIKNATKNKTPLCFVMMDIDHFKNINDIHGHYVGDQALTHIAHLLKQNIRETDILARWGGEEMAILLPKTNLVQALACTEHLRATIEDNPLIVDGEEVVITASFGVAVAHHNEPLDELFKRADEQLYKAKNQGRNRIGYTPNN